MKQTFFALVGLGMLMGGEVAVAQEGNPVLFSAYYTCDQSRELVADLLVGEAIAPILDRHVAAGDLNGWGWLAHRVGGSWRRAEFMAASNFETLLSTRNAIIQERQQEAGAASAEFNRICPEHDDYIWNQVAASGPATAGLPPAPARMSTYYRCNAGRAARADEIFNESLAPIMNRHTSDSALRGWGWWAHLVGGEYRRFLTMNAVDGPTLYTHWGAALNEMANDASEAWEEFNRICGAHTDYQWANGLP
ncbi:MAG: hypothetical protein OEO23_15495, partial [Gemmatimonadota bacterium]|nr:hypothetical protein [Gemmatimonadota bacterium]